MVEFAIIKFAALLKYPWNQLSFWIWFTSCSYYTRLKHFPTVEILAQQKGMQVLTASISHNFAESHANPIPPQGGDAYAVVIKGYAVSK